MFARVRYPALGDLRVFVSWAWLGIVLALAATTISILWPDEVTLGWTGTVVLGFVGIIGSLTIHEVSHVIVARKFSQRLRGISPDLLGGLPDTCYHAVAPSHVDFPSRPSF